MFVGFYGFSANPFQLNPVPAYYFESKGHGSAYAYLKYGDFQSEGFLVITGEMGRSPTKSGKGGSGHWGELTPLALAGGGLMMGQVIGRSDAQGGMPATERYGPENLMATVLQTLFDAGEVRVTPESPSTVAKLITDTNPITELM